MEYLKSQWYFLDIHMSLCLPRKPLPNYLYHGMENIVGNTIYEIYTQDEMGRLGVILLSIHWLSCISMVWYKCEYMALFPF